MRVSQRMMYNNFQTGMNDTLSAYMESNIQSASQKKINKPSDDPVGMQEVLRYRASIALNKQYEDNSQDVYHHLSSVDSALTQAQTILVSIKEKMEAASTGSVTSEQRAILGREVKELFKQLVNLANTSFNGEQLFAGHKTTQPAYEIGLGVSTTDPNLNNVERTDGSSGGLAYKIEGAADSTVMVRFVGQAGDTFEVGTDNIDYVFSKDGGKTWSNPKTMTAPDHTLDLDGVSITIPVPGPNHGDPVAPIKVTAFDPEPDGVSRDNGTVLFVRPTAYYKGDTADLPPLIDTYGTTQLNGVKAFGSFYQDVRIRVDEQTNVNQDGSLNFSYSVDNGVTWIQAPAATTHAGSNTVRIEVPGGGYLDVDTTGGVIEAGQQFVVRPQRAHQGTEINEGTYMSSTQVGKDIFGGVYTPYGYDNPIPAGETNKNMFEVISDFIAWAESGIQDGCQVELAALNTAMEGLVTEITRNGGKMNRVSLNITMLENNRDDKTSRMSSIEDADLTELLIKLSQQQMAYQTVLQSSSMIMGLNLANYL